MRGSRRDLRHQLGGQVEVLGLDRGVALRLGAERVEPGGEVAVGPVGLEQGGRRLDGLQQAPPGRCDRRGRLPALCAAGVAEQRRQPWAALHVDDPVPDRWRRTRRSRPRPAAAPRSGAGTIRIGALDHAVVVGRGHRHDLETERLDLLRRVCPLDRIGERAAGDDRALPAHQARHRGDGPSPPGLVRLMFVPWKSSAVRSFSRVLVISSS